MASSARQLAVSDFRPNDRIIRNEALTRNLCIGTGVPPCTVAELALATVQGTSNIDYYDVRLPTGFPLRDCTPHLPPIAIGQRWYILPLALLL